MKKAIVIGASSGIGNALAKLLVHNNYKVGITARRSKELESLKQTAPTHFIISSFDCTTAENSAKIEELVHKLGGLDLLIFCSGIGELNHSLNLKIEQETNKLNVIAFTEIINWSINYFLKKQAGHFVCISSIAGLRGSKIAPAYNASKAYQINYLEGIRQKLHQTKLPIYITDVRPGFVNTRMAKGAGLFWVAPKQKAAQQIFRAIKKKRSICYITKRWIIFALLLKNLPHFIYKKL
ncbi:SDR family NAD(P)-dependent oxidoreductase [Aquimarina agarilytica]|uniref:SDR family NAD(P)-dependent oxidoreductase n=1 Tax=Aquimarina agarilytica TaxID=1087449 RepID=UPI000288AA38|nr:SDR family NAD(P)-dependent oxidoreductase [Aquimarina agarilytica]